MNDNQKIVTAAVALIKKLRSLKEEGQYIAKAAELNYNGDVNDAEYNIAKNIDEISELMAGEIHDETVDLIQALWQADREAASVQDTGCYLTRQEYIDGQNKKIKDAYSDLNDTLKSLADKIKDTD